MGDLSYKVRISVLWLLEIVAFFTYRTLAVSEGAEEVSVLGNTDFATYLLVAMSFAFLSLVLPSGLSRLMNIIAGSIFGIIQVIMLVDGMTGYRLATFNLLTGATIVVMAAVVWFAWRWPEAAGEESRQAPLAEQTQPEMAIIAHGIE
jgi:predicted membrane channel-forming protein YqfA (hemolysin III family)